LRDGRAHPRGALARPELVERPPGSIGRWRVLPGRAQETEAPPPAAQTIDGPGARERRQEGAERAPARIECRRPAQHHEHILREAPAPPRRLEEGAAEPIPEAAVAIVEGRERSRIPGEGPEQLLVGRAG